MPHDPEREREFNDILKYPTLATVFKDSEIEEANSRLHIRRETFPELLCCIVDHRVNLDMAEEGLGLVYKKASRGIKNDIVGRLRDKDNRGTVFELAVLGAIRLQFGDDSVTPYPRIPGSDKLLEAEVALENQFVCVEATVLGFGEEQDRLIREAQEQGGVGGVGWLKGTGEGRMHCKLEEKLSRYCPDKPNILVLSQMTDIPSLTKGAMLIRKHLAGQTESSPSANFAGILYFKRYKFEEWIQNPNVCSTSSIGSDVIGYLCEAAQRIYP